jgi:hypothetical protein
LSHDEQKRDWVRCAGSCCAILSCPTRIRNRADRPGTRRKSILPTAAALCRVVCSSVPQFKLRLFDSLGSMQPEDKFSQAPVPRRVRPVIPLSLQGAHPQIWPALTSPADPIIQGSHTVVCTGDWVCAHSDTSRLTTNQISRTSHSLTPSSRRKEVHTLQLSTDMCLTRVRSSLINDVFFRHRYCSNIHSPPALFATPI